MSKPNTFFSCFEGTRGEKTQIFRTKDERKSDKSKSTWLSRNGMRKEQITVMGFTHTMGMVFHFVPFLSKP